MSNVKTPSALHRNLLVGGFKHFLFSILYGMSSFPLTNMFQDGYCTTNQLATSGLKTASFLHVAMENPQRMMAF